MRQIEDKSVKVVLDDKLQTFNVVLRDGNDGFKIVEITVVLNDDNDVIKIVDVTDVLIFNQKKVEDNLELFCELVSDLTQCPLIEIGEHCKYPYNSEIQSICKQKHFSVMVFVNNYETCEDPRTVPCFYDECTDKYRYDNFLEAVQFFHRPSTKLYFVENLSSIEAKIIMVSADSIEALAKKENCLIEIMYQCSEEING